MFIDVNLLPFNNRMEEFSMLTGYDCFSEHDVQMAISISETYIGTKGFSITFLQRFFKKGYMWTARLMEELELREVVGPHNGEGYREVLVHEPFQIKITDELGKHILQSNRDCSWTCKACNTQKKVTRRDLDSTNMLRRPTCNCSNRKMNFSYWLDCMD